MDKETVDRKVKKAIPTEPIDPQELLERYTKYMTQIIESLEGISESVKNLLERVEKKE